ncbi:MAG: proline racemase family protein [Acidobacteriota bacterium]|nr:proline racemase family protein [Acidobacteriota bacterium]MDH3522235.1 proline racemase family protein [Acidobacteriota bacterium]
MPLDLDAARRWEPPASWRRVLVVDAHTGGEPFRVVVEGHPAIPGATMLAKRRWAEEHADALRRLLVLEPRGHADMYGCFLTEPVSPGSDFGILFLHNAGFSTMCGHGIIAISTVVLETGMLARMPAGRTPAAGNGFAEQALDLAIDLAIDSPAGPVRARAALEGGRVARVAFRNVPSFVVELDAAIEVPAYGRVRYDLAFGGAFYAVVSAPSVGLQCTAERFADIVAAGREIKRAIVAGRAIEHPLAPDLGFLYGVVFVGPAADASHHSRNVCVFADGEVDRSPTGTGVSARLAIHHARGDLLRGQAITVESLLGSTFRGRVVAETSCGPYPAIVPEVEGSATICGRYELLLDPADPFPRGFLLR